MLAHVIEEMLMTDEPHTVFQRIISDPQSFYEDPLDPTATASAQGELTRTLIEVLAMKIQEKTEIEDLVRNQRGSVALAEQLTARAKRIAKSRATSAKN